MLTKLGAWLKPYASKVMPATGSIAALSCFSVAGFTVNLTVGLCVTGAALLLAEWRMVEPQTESGEHR